MKAVNLYPRNTQASVRPAPVTVDRFAGMTNDQIRKQLDQDAETRRVKHEAEMARMADMRVEQDELLKRYQAGTATFEEPMAFHQRAGII